MVVMLLMTIVLAVTIPRFDNSLALDPTKKVTRWVIDTVRSLRAKALAQQKTCVWAIDLSNNRMWASIDTAAETDTEEGAGESESKIFVLPNGFNLVDVQFPNGDRITSGSTEVFFYPGGYSDQLLIHAEYNKDRRLTFMIEPLLPSVKVVDEWISY
jgi:hypothetical protein